MADAQTPATLLLGAEQQAATSVALAYPERLFGFAAESLLIDGWELPNVSIIPTMPGAASELSEEAADEVIPLSPRWMSDAVRTRLSAVMPKIEVALPGLVLPVTPRPERDQAVIAKGDLWHRPDAPISGHLGELFDLTDPHGCGLVYQEQLETQGSVLAIGRRWDGFTALGLFRVLSERFFRIEVLQAAESVDMPELAELSLAAIAALDHQGWFTLNWLLTGDGPRLSSFRPVPRAAFACFRRGGIDLLGREPRSTCLSAGLRLIAMPTYIPITVQDRR